MLDEWEVYAYTSDVGLTHTTCGFEIDFPDVISLQELVRITHDHECH